MLHSGREVGKRYNLNEVRDMVLQDMNMQNLTDEAKDQYISTLAQARDVKQHGVRANNAAAAQDVLATTDRISREVSHLFFILCCFRSISHAARFPP